MKVTANSLRWKRSFLIFQLVTCSGKIMLEKNGKIRIIIQILTTE